MTNKTQTLAILGTAKLKKLAKLGEKGDDAEMC
jgi:hypothetical protein